MSSRPRRKSKQIATSRRMRIEALESRRVLDSTVVFNEIMYHPLNDESLEFIELHNQMAVDMDISSWRISGGVEFQFAEGTVVPGGGHLVVAKDPMALGIATGFGAAKGPYLGQLSNNGELLELRDRNDRLMDEIDFGAGGQWSVAPDGSGASLAKLDPNSTSDDSRLWSSSILVGGTPGQRNFPDTEIAKTTSELVTLASSWRYEASDVFPGPDWAAAGFDDSTWSSGEPIFFAGNAQLDEMQLEMVTDVAVSASSELVGFDRKAAYVVDGSGLVGETHVIAPDGNMWLNQGSFGGAPADLDPEITFDLGSVRKVDHIKVWNYNEELPNRPELLSRGVSSADILVAGEDQNFSVLIANQPFDKGSGAQTDFSQTIDLGQVDARYIKFDIHGNFPGGDNDFVGLSEVQFFAVGDALQSELPLGASTYYYRTEFEFNGDVSTADLFLDHVVDDGAIFYLNGTEIYRHNLPAGPVSHVTTAATAVAKAIRLSDIIVPSGALVEGTNVLAAEVHQSGAADADMVFGAELSVDSIILDPPIEATLVAYEEFWSYEATGADQGTAWRERDFDDSGWLGNAVGLIGYWTLDGDGVAAIGEDGTMVGGPQTTTDRNGVADGALAFNGINQSVNVPGGGGLDGANAGTISLWVKWSGTQDADCCSTFGAVLARQSNGQFSDSIIALDGPNPATANIVWRQSGGPAPVLITGTSVVGDDTWHHIAVTFSPAGSELYVDGVSEGTAQGAGMNSNTNVALSIGAWIGDGGGFSSSSIDDVAIWSNVLSAGQIAALANQTSTPFDFDANIQAAFFAGDARVDGGGSPGNGELPLGPTTYYFRKEFSFLEDPSRTRLFLDSIIDDGAVYYLNGTEIHRHNMPAGEVAFDTVAATAVDAAEVIGEIQVPASSLVTGRNVLAVEVHQSAVAADTDMLFDATLRSVTTSPLPTDFDIIPLSINETAAAAADDVWFEVVNHGEEAINLSGFIVGSSRGSEHTLTGLSLGRGTFHTIRETNLGYDLANGDRIHIYSPDRTLVVAAAEIKNSLKGRWPDVVGPFLFPDVATPNSANSFAFHDEIVINEIMYHHRPRQGSPEVPATFATTEIVALDDVWRYNDSGEALASDWHQTNHAVGGNWSEGPGLIGYQRFDFILQPPGLGTKLADPRTVTPRVTTFYFELDFEITDEELADVDHLELEHLIDDGAIFYLNGSEVHRINMPVGAVTSSTLASQTVNLSTRVSDPFTISTDALEVGLNRLSVEVHQDSADSEDIMFGARLSVARETDPGRPEVPYLEIPEEWVELYNRGTTVIDLTGWKFDDGIDFDFPSGTTLGPGEYLVVSNDAVALREKYPEVADRIVGDFSRRLNNFSDRIVLEDSRGNPADVVEYFEGGQWPSAADGDGASLELRDPDADNSVGLSWAASDEALRSAWRTYTYEGVAEPSSIGPDGQWEEFLMGFLTDGEVLLDDISVVQDPAGAAVELIQNGSFDADPVGDEASAWRIIGNHRHSEVITDPVDPANQVLRFVGTGATEHMHNHAETTLKDGNSLVTIQNGQTYRISFRAKWISGSGQLHTRLYFNRLARVNLIEQPELHGTPGRQNSTVEDNIGPTYRGFHHGPAVPDPDEAVTVFVVASDPDGVADMTLWYSVDGGAWTSSTMNVNGVQFSGEIPGQNAASIVQFYVEGQDALGAVTTFPRAGRESRALYKVQDGLASDTGLHNLRIIVTPQDADFLHTTVELMSNDRIGATLIYNESEIFYDASVRLSGSERARPFQPRLSFAVRFNPDRLFRGVHEGVTLDRSESTFFGQREHLYHHAMNHAGGLPSEYNDLFHIITPRLEHTGSAEAQLARYSDLFLDSQFENGSDGRLYEYELTYYPTTTTGGPEGRKRPQPDGVEGIGIRSQGPDREDYRWAFLNKSNRRQDDYSRLIEFTQAMGRTGAEFHDTIGEFMDVDQWLRAFAFSVLTGHGDNYGSDGAQHNLQLYVRPADQRVLFFPHDLDAFFSVSRPIVQNGDLQKLISLPRNAHMYYGHVNDMIETTFNQSYMEPWAAHWGRLLPAQNFDSHLSQMVARSNFLLGEIRSRAAEIDFEITTADLTVDASEATVIGNGWVNVREIRLAGSSTALPTDWPTVTGFEVTVPVGLGANAVTLEAYDFQGELIGTDTITITSTVNNPASEFLRISEIHYNPPAPTAGELAVDSGLNNDDFEFIEVQNTGGESINLLNVSFTDGIDYIFPSTVLAPSERGVIVRDVDAFELRYGNNRNVLGQYRGGLSNAGENLTLADATGVTIVDFTYDDQESWPETADGVGASLELVDVATSPGQLGKYYHWRGSTQFGGSPGAAGIEPIGVVLNEVLAHTDPPIAQSDSIELLNTTGAVVDISGWYLSDAGSNLLKFEIPAGTELGPGEYVVFDEADFNPSLGVDPDLHPRDFALSGAAGDDVYLVIAGEVGGVARFVDDVHFGASANGESFGRVPGVVGRLAPMTSLTLGGANSAPRVGPVLISEVHYNPGVPSPAALAADPNVAADDLEFLEIYNPTNAAVDLTEWRIRGGVDFNFAPGLSLAAGETLVLIPFNPGDIQNANRLAAFRAHYDIDAGTTLLGGYAGQLSDSGERVELQRPDSPPPEDPLFIPRLSEDTVFYDNLPPWETSAAGEGDSLNRSGVSAYGNLSGSWFAGLPSPGTVDLDLPGDFTGDGVVNVEDINALFAAISDGNPDPRFDLDGNGNVGQSDVVFLVENTIGTFMGDANLDGRVDAADLNVVGINWRAANVTGWEQGDFNGDDGVAAADLNIIGLNWLRGAPIAAVHQRVPRAPLAALVGGGRVQHIDAVFSDESPVRFFASRNGDLRPTSPETLTSLSAQDVIAELAVSNQFAGSYKKHVNGRNRARDQSNDYETTHDPLKAVDGLFRELDCHP